LFKYPHFLVLGYALLLFFRYSATGKYSGNQHSKISVNHPYYLAQNLLFQPVDRKGYKLLYIL